jgi:hypothetical protein
MMKKHMIVQLTSYDYTRPYQASYQVVRGRKIANMVSNWPAWINTNFHAWKLDLRQLQEVDAVDFRLTSEAGVWQGRIPRRLLPASFVSFNCNAEGVLKPRGKYFSYFKKVG